MTIDDLRNARYRNPFFPFRIHMQGGRAVDVMDRDFIMLSPTGMDAAAYLPDGHMERISIPAVAAVEELS